MLFSSPVDDDDYDLIEWNIMKNCYIFIMNMLMYKLLIDWLFWLLF